MGKLNMDNKISLFTLAFWSTIILAILKITDIIEISNLTVFLPLIVVFGLFFIVIFFIGLLVTIFYLNNKEEVDKFIDDNMENRS